MSLSPVTYRTFLFTIIMIIIFSGCRTLRFVPENETLYVGANITLKSDATIEEKAALSRELNKLLKPSPNKKIFFSRFGLWSHYKGRREKSSFITRFLNKKFGEEPVYFSEANPSRTATLIRNRLENKGYFFSDVDFSLTTAGNKTSISYVAQISEPYRLATYSLTADTLGILKEINRALDQTLLTQGQRFDLETMEAERMRINDHLRQKGYYNFRDDYLIFRVDTNQYTKRKYDLYLSLKTGTQKEALKRYEVRNVYVHPNYTISNSDSNVADTAQFKGLFFVDNKETFRSDLLRDYILVEPGELYQLRNSRLTTSRLSNLETYKYTSSRYNIIKDASTDSLGQLDLDIYLSTKNKHSIGLEVQAVTKSNSFAGPGLNISFQDRNFFRGGEIFDLSAKFGYETQFGNKSSDDNTAGSLNSYEFTLSSGLTVPRIIAPVNINTRDSYTMPKTRFGTSFSLLNRVLYYKLTSVQLDYQFIWKSNRFVTHQLTPIFINFTNTANTTAEFDAILEDNAFLARSFENQFIPAASYRFQYSQLNELERRHRFFAATSFELAGNLFALGKKVFGTGEDDRFLNRRFSRYARVDLDFRHFFKTTEKSALVSRIFAGIGAPIGNTLSLPYIKQYFSGGPNSLRGFRVRSVGPGTYRPDESEDVTFFDQAGDIKLEANIEYRFPMISYLKGAVFADSGNIWLFNDNEDVPNGVFTKNWYREMALNIGYGFRFDIEFLVVRFDIATPLRKPYLDEGNRWLDEFKPLNRSWRRENMLLNFAIGYPF